MFEDLAEDKKKHLFCGFIISLGGGIMYMPLIISGFIAGAVKEWWDSKGHGQVEKADFIWTCYGAAAGSIGAVIAKYVIGIGT